MLSKSILSLSLLAAASSAHAIDCSRPLTVLVASSTLALLPAPPARADMMTNEIAKEMESNISFIDSAIENFVENGRLRTTWKVDRPAPKVCFGHGMTAGSSSSRVTRDFLFANPNDPQQMAAVRAWPEIHHEYIQTLTSLCGAAKPYEQVVVPLQLSSPAVDRLRSVREKMREIQRVFARPEATRRSGPRPSQELPNIEPTLQSANSLIRNLRARFPNLRANQTLSVLEQSQIAFQVAEAHSGLWYAGIDYARAFQRGTPGLQVTGSTECTSALTRAGEKFFSAGDGFAGRVLSNAKVPYQVMSPEFMRFINEAEPLVERARATCRKPGTQTYQTRLTDLVRGFGAQIEEDISRVSVNGRVRSTWAEKDGPQTLCSRLASNSPLKLVEPMVRLTNDSDPAQKSAYERFSADWLRYIAVGKSFCGITPASKAIVPPGQLSEALLSELTQLKNDTFDIANVYASPARIPLSAPATVVPVRYAEEIANFEKELKEFLAELLTRETSGLNYIEQLNVSFRLEVLSSKLNKFSSWGAPTPECDLAAGEIRKDLAYLSVDESTGQIRPMVFSALRSAIEKLPTLKAKCR